MPIDSFRWLTSSEVKVLTLKQILNYNETSEIGMILEVDVEIPNSIHDYTNDYPLFPEPMEINETLISDKSKRMREERDYPLKFSNIKLAPNLHHKTKYVVHIRNLQFYLQKGAVLKKIHRVISFRQEAWISPYVELNTRMRKLAIDEYEKNVFKLFVNALFGKCMENVRKRMLCKLVGGVRGHAWYTSQPGKVK